MSAAIARNRDTAIGQWAQQWSQMPHQPMHAVPTLVDTVGDGRGDALIVDTVGDGIADTLVELGSSIARGDALLAQTSPSSPPPGVGRGTVRHGRRSGARS